MAVGFIVLFFERALVQLFHAVRTDKVLRVELLLHGSDASSSDGLVAASAEGTPHCVIMDLTIRDAIMVEETATVEWHAALLERSREQTVKCVCVFNTNDLKVWQWPLLLQCVCVCVTYNLKVSCKRPCGHKYRSVFNTTI